MLYQVEMLFSIVYYLIAKARKHSLLSYTYVCSFYLNGEALSLVPLFVKVVELHNIHTINKMKQNDLYLPACVF
jgi:hypothetical protein